MIRIFFYWLFNKSKTLKNLLHISTEKNSKELIERIKKVLEINQNRSLRRKWKRITENKNSPFYIYK